MPAPNPSNWTRDKAPRKPFGWNPAGAVPFFELYSDVALWIKPNFPLSRAMVMLLFFHESAFSNAGQLSNSGKPSGPAVGFGQMEIHNTDKAAYFDEIGYGLGKKNPGSPFPLIDFGRLTSDFQDPDFALKTHCNWFVWLKEKRGKTSSKAILRAQLGDDNTDLLSYFVDAEPELVKVAYSGDRAKVIDALNQCRYYLKRDPTPPHKVIPGTKPEHQPIKLDDFKDYWDYTLPANRMVQGSWQ